MPSGGIVHGTASTSIISPNFSSEIGDEFATQQTSISNTCSSNRKDTISQNLAHEISEWALKFNISHEATNGVLNIFNGIEGIVLPKDARTILKTPKEISTVPMGVKGSHIYVFYYNF